MRRMMLPEELRSRQKEIESYLVDVSDIGILLVDPERNILDCNQGFIRMFQLRREPVGSPVTDFLQLGDNDLNRADELKLSLTQRSGLKGIAYCRSLKTAGRFLIFCERFLLTESRAIEEMGVLNNQLINQQRESVKKNLILEKMKRELDGHILDLEAALSRVKQLEGIIPICSYCKKIRDDQDDWHRLEKYISDHSEAQFSHGICPACLEKELEAMEP